MAKTKRYSQSRFFALPKTKPAKTLLFRYLQQQTSPTAGAQPQQLNLHSSESFEDAGMFPSALQNTPGLTDLAFCSLVSSFLFSSYKYSPFLWLLSQLPVFYKYFHCSTEQMQDNMLTSDLKYLENSSYMQLF